MTNKNVYFAPGYGIDQRYNNPSISFYRIIKIMSILLDSAKGKTDIKDRKVHRRGYLTILDARTGFIICTLPFLEIPVEKEELYFRLSQEKADRLYSWVNKHLPAPNNHTTSYESRDESMDHYGGSVYGEFKAFEFNVQFHIQLILSFSGMPELIDEAMMLVLVKFFQKKWKNLELLPISAESRNPFWQSIAEEFFNHKLIKEEIENF